MGAGQHHALYVYGHSPVHRLAPETKVAAAFVFVSCVALTPRRSVWAFLAYAAALLAVLLIASIPVRLLLVRLTVLLPFMAFAVLMPFVATGERVDVLGASVSAEGVRAMWSIMAKALLGATVSVLLAATTEVPELLKGMARLRVPTIFISITSFMVRYMELIVRDLGRMRTAMTARGYRPRWLWQARPIASAAGSMFIRSYERAERVHAAMLARGYTGVMPDVGGAPATSVEWMKAGVLPLVGVLIVAIALSAP